MNRKAYASVLALILLAIIFLPGCSSSSPPPPPPVESIAAMSGTPQSAVVNTAFTGPLVAKVTTGGSPTSGAVVTFTAPTTGASGTFAGGVITATTDANGLATSAVFTANGTTGSYIVTATVAGVSTAANFNLTNTAAPTANNYSFYLTGMELINSGPNFYAVAGSVTIDPSGNVTAGEQDYNDAFGLTSPQPSGDTITGGTLTADPATGQGTLTLVTNNSLLGVSGTETLGVQFANTKHAIIVQFDGTATSSGSMDFQALPSTLSGPYAFTLSGVDTNYLPVVFGGVFSISGAGLQNGIVDIDDAGLVTLGVPFSATISAPDSFGRGTITNTGIATTLNYYIVGPEAIRIIDVDALDSAVGSAFGQGAGAFSNASLGSSVFGVESNSFGFVYAAAGMITTVPAGGTFQGVADDIEEGVPFGGAIPGAYSIASNGYGSLTITPGDLGDVSALGIYMTDPNLNLNDPNNTANGLGGALVADLDTFLNGTGVLTPQTDTSTASFAGNYAYGAQDFWGCGAVCEFDLVGQGSVSGGVLTGTGLLSDPSFAFSAGATNSGVAFSGTATPDVSNAGRYTVVPFVITTVAGTPVDFQVVIYQASGGQLFWLDVDIDFLSLGAFQQQGSLSGLPAARRGAARTKAKRKP
jgi:hypothetical protein